MLTNYLRVCNYRQLNVIYKACVSTQPSILKEKWDILTSVCLERKPVITPLLNDLETQFQKYLSQVELERSLKSDHEIRHENDKKQAILLKQQDTADLDAASAQTAQDFLDACTEELAKFQFANRQTEADTSSKNDTESLERKLDKYLVLLSEQKVGKRTYFLPPQGVRKDGETLRQTAQRLVNDICGPDMKVQIYGNAPVGFYKYKYPKDVQEKNGTCGAKVFIYFARYLKGHVSSSKDNKNTIKWLDRIEMAKEMPEDYFKSMAKFLIDETPTVTTSNKKLQS